MLFEPILHFVDFALLFANDVACPFLGLIVFAVLQYNFRHLDCSLMMCNHAFDESHVRRPFTRVSNGRAQVTEVTIGHRNNRIAEVISGLSAGDRVVLHPSDKISKGVAVKQRETQ